MDPFHQGVHGPQQVVRPPQVQGGAVVRNAQGHSRRRGPENFGQAGNQLNFTGRSASHGFMGRLPDRVLGEGTRGRGPLPPLPSPLP